MSEFDWEIFLKQESRQAIAVYKQGQCNPDGEMDFSRAKRWYRAELPLEVLESEWLGFAGASEREIKAAEVRLGLTFPPSYRTFLKVTNGWPDWCNDMGLLPPSELEWFCTENQGWIDIWMEGVKEIPSIPDKQYFVYENGNNSVPIRPEYLQTALLISTDSDLGVILLNPRVIHNKEWEAWIFSGDVINWRYRSFLEMLQVRGMNNWA